jgi:hypothetical protein
MFETSADRNAPNNGQPKPKISLCVYKCHMHDMWNGSRNTHTLVKALTMPGEETDQFGNKLKIIINHGGSMWRHRVGGGMGGDDSTTGHSPQGRAMGSTATDNEQGTAGSQSDIGTPARMALDWMRWRWIGCENTSAFDRTYIFRKSGDRAIH